MPSKIEWTDETWNPTTGCSKVSAGCKHCFAEIMHRRLRAMGQKKYQHEFSDVRFHPDALDAPLHWRKPRMVFVNSMSDLFHEDVAFGQIDEVFSVMHEARRHTFQVLTKRPARMLDYMTKHIRNFRAWGNTNIWFGVSVEDQPTADERIPLLRPVPAAVHFVSLEPMLEPVVFDWCEECGGHGQGRHGSGQPDEAGDERECGPSLMFPPIDWVICGAESGPKARSMDPQWAQSIVDQCGAAGVACFVKQIHLDHDTSRPRLSKDPAEFPPGLQVREWPAARAEVMGAAS